MEGWGTMMTAAEAWGHRSLQKQVGGAQILPRRAARCPLLSINDHACLH